MARIEYAVSEDDATGDAGAAALAPLIERIVAERGGLLNLYRMLLNSPPIAEGWLAMGTAVRHRSSLDGRARELAICRVGQLNGATYEWEHHVPIAKREGVSDAQIAALTAWSESDAFDDRERALLAYADTMTRDVVVPDDVFAAVRAHFDRRELVELTTTIAFYNMVSRVLVALGVDLE